MAEPTCDVNNCDKNTNKPEHFQCPFESVRTVIQDFAMGDKKLQWQISLTREHPEPENSKNSETLWICRGLPSDYNAIFFAAQNHSKGVKLTPEDSAILTREL